MEQEEFSYFESLVLDALEGKLSAFRDENEKKAYIEKVAKEINREATDDEIKRVIADTNNFSPIDGYLSADNVEDIMINNTSSVFIYKNDTGQTKAPEALSDAQLDALVKKMKMYATTEVAQKNIFDVHLPNGSRANIVNSPRGAAITIRNFRRKALSIIDLINLGELSYSIAARLWLYVDGLRVRPANILIGGMPATGKTTLLNAMLSFFRPETRLVVIEETYELNTETQENTVRLETNPEITLEELVKNALRMRPDTIIIGEVRGREAKDMLTAMNIGKIVMGTIHASNARDVIQRLQHTPMNVDQDIIPLIDAIVMLSEINNKMRFTRKVSQISEISGIETKVLLSDLYQYDYKTGGSADILPSVTYRDSLSRISGYTPVEIIVEEQRRAKILEQLNKRGVRQISDINAFIKDYYDNSKAALTRIDSLSLGTLE